MQRLVALLFALAGLAERAAAAPMDVRALVLMFLRNAELATQGILFETGYGQPMPAADESNSADDALRLAERFRALASLLLSLTARALAPWEDGPCSLHSFDEPGISRQPVMRSIICPSLPWGARWPPG